MSNINDAYSTAMTEEYIRTLSTSKLEELYHSNVDQSIRKFVLITNLLRNEEPPKEQEDDDMLEQQWLNSCLDELQDDDIEDDPMDTTPEGGDNEDEHTYADDKDPFREAPSPYWSVVAAAAAATATVNDDDLNQLYYTFRNYHKHWLA